MADARRAVLGLLTVLLGCGSGGGPVGPGATGPEFFTASVDGQGWTPVLVVSTCSHRQLTLTAARVIAATSTIETLQLHLEAVGAPGPFGLGDSAGGRWGLLAVDSGSGARRDIFRTAAPGAGVFRVTGLTLQDSLLAGRFSLVVVNDTAAGESRTIAGEFRARLAPVYTVQEPDGTPCEVQPGPL